MSEPFGVTPAELRSVSSDLNDASSQMKGVMSALQGQLAAEGTPWGGGSIGAAATGPNGYLAQGDWVDGSVDAKTNLLDYYSGMLKQAADSFEQSDNT